MRRAPSRTHRLTWRSADVEERRLPRGTFPFVNSSSIGATPRMAWLPAGHMGGRGRARWLQHLKPAASGGANKVTSEGANEAAQGDVAYTPSRHTSAAWGGWSLSPAPPSPRNEPPRSGSFPAPAHGTERLVIEACGLTTSQALNSPTTILTGMSQPTAATAPSAAAAALVDLRPDAFHRGGRHGGGYGGGRGGSERS